VTNNKFYLVTNIACCKPTELVVYSPVLLFVVSDHFTSLRQQSPAIILTNQVGVISSPNPPTFINTRHRRIKLG